MKTQAVYRSIAKELKVECKEAYYGANSAGGLNTPHSVCLASLVGYSVALNSHSVHAHSCRRFDVQLPGQTTQTKASILEKHIWCEDLAANRSRLCFGTIWLAEVAAHHSVITSLLFRDMPVRLRVWLWYISSVFNDSMRNQNIVALAPTNATLFKWDICPWTLCPLGSCRQRSSRTWRMCNFHRRCCVWIATHISTNACDNPLYSPRHKRITYAGPPASARTCCVPASTRQKRRWLAHYDDKVAETALFVLLSRAITTLDFRVTSLAASRRILVYFGLIGV